jgi:predicted DNA-binding transcriptional regulator YafY
VRGERLVSLLLLLQLGRAWTAGELAGRLGVSVRTVHRDVDALAAAGVPVQRRRGVGGGFRLRPGARTVVPLTGDEVQALLAGGPGAAAPLGLGGLLVDAQLKLLAALPPEARRAAARDFELIHVDEPRWFAEPEPVPVLTELAAAARERRRVRLEYRRGGRTAPAPGVADPLGLVLKAGVWYLVARTGGRVRVYRASRVLAVTPLDERFTRPRGFRLPEAWERSRQAFEAGRPRVDVTVRVRPADLPVLRDAVDWTVRPTVDAGGARVGDGRLELRLPFERLEHAHADLAPLGGAVEVVDPPELRARLAATGRGLARRHAGGLLREPVG